MWLPLHLDASFLQSAHPDARLMAFLSGHKSWICLQKTQPTISCVHPQMPWSYSGTWGCHSLIWAYPACLSLEESGWGHHLEWHSPRDTEVHKKYRFVMTWLTRLALASVLGPFGVHMLTFILPTLVHWCTNKLGSLEFPVRICDASDITTHTRPTVIYPMIAITENTWSFDYFWHSFGL